jgi:hypothetical protein
MIELTKTPTSVQALQRFKSKVKRRMIGWWTNKSDLHAQFVTSLNTYIRDHPRRGWVRAPEAGTVAKLTEENARLRQTVEEMKSKDEINDIIDLLATQKIDHRSGSELFVDMAGAERINPYLHSRDLWEVFDKFRVWGLLLARGGGGDWSVTPLGQRVYNRLDLGRRSSPPF